MTDQDPSRDAEAMITACSFGRIDRVRELLDSGVPVDSRNEKGYMALHYAVLNGSKALCELLIERGHPLDELDSLDRSALHLAAVCDKPDLVELLAAKGANLNVPGENKWTPLHTSIREDKVRSVKLLAKLGADLEARDIGLCTPLLVAAFSGDVDVFKALLDLGASIAAVDDFDNNVFHLISKNTSRQHVRDLEMTGLKDGDKDVVLWIRNGKIGVTVGGEEMKIAKKTFESLLGHGCPQYFRYQALVKVAKIALDRGADIHAKNKDGFTPLHAFAEAGDLEIVKPLVKAGAKIDERSNAQMTALQLAARRGHLEIVTFLVGKKAALNTADEYGCGPLHEAAENGHLECVEYLLKKKANPTQKTTKGWDDVPSGLTPLDLAQRGGHESVVAMLTGATK